MIRNLIETEVFKTDDQGNHIASEKALEFFKDLIESEKIAVNKQYVDDDIYIYRMLCLECEVLDTIYLEDKAQKFEKGDEIFLEVIVDETCESRDSQSRYGETNLIYVVDLVNDWNIDRRGRIDFSKKFEII